MAFIYSVICSFKYEVCEICKNRLYRTSLLLLPLVTLLFFATIFYRGSIEKLPIVIIDNDHSQTSRKLLGMISATRSIEIWGYTNSVAEAEALLRRGDVYAILLIPEEFESSIYGSTSAHLECYISGTNLSASGVIESALQNTVRTFAAGVSISKLEAKGIRRRDALREVMPINTLTHTISNPYMNYGYYLAPIFMFMSLAIFTTLLTVYAVGRELYYSSARRWLATCGGRGVAATIGKLLPTTIVMILYSQLILLILFVVMGMECSGSYVTLTVGSILFVVAYQSVALFIVALSSNMRLALSLGGGYAVMAFTFSGITFPTMAMFDIARWLSVLFPLSWFSDIFVDQAMRGAPPQHSLLPLAYLASFVVLPIAASRRLRGILLIPKFWHRD